MAELDLPFIWAGIIAFAVLVYVILDGFDLGVGYPVSVTPMPTDQELHALRQIDVDRA